jgi:nucleotide-binding universal stress UspA family protein
MLKVERILCPVDFSKASGIAYNYAESFARRYDAALYVEHVVEPFGPAFGYYSIAEASKEIREGINSEAREHLKRFVVAHRHNGHSPQGIVEEGPVAEGILDCAEREDTSLIVTGTRVRRGVDRLLPGPVKERSCADRAFPRGGALGAGAERAGFVSRSALTECANCGQ